MRLVLRNYEQLSYRFKKNNYRGTYNQNQDGSEATQENAQYSNKLHKGGKRFNQNYKNNKQGTTPTVYSFAEIEPDQEWLQFKKEQMQMLNSPAPGSLKLEGTWEYVADSVLIKDYEFLRPLNKNDTAQQLIKRYQNNLKLHMEDHLMPKLYQEDIFIKRMAKYHASEVGPLTASFLRQGYNFVDKKLIIHLLTTENIKTIKQLLLGGAFQTAECIDDEVVVHLLARFEQHQRNHFLINLLPFHVELLTGEIRIDNAKSFDEQVAQEVNQRQFFNIMYLSNGSTSINKLRVLWSLQRRFLHKFNLMQFMVPQLKKITFLTKDPQTQILINKEVNHVMTTLFQSQVFEDIFFKMLETTKTFPNFFKAWSFTFLLLSKLRSIPKVLDRSNSKQLHSIFQLIEMNLPKDVADQFMRTTVLQILLLQEHNTILRHNYFKCLEHWGKDYVQPPTTLYNSPLTAILNQNNPTLTISYHQHDKANQFATTNIVLNRKNIDEKSAIITQSEVIHNLLKGNYQSVFDDFLVRYSLPSSFDAATKFQMKLKEADKNLSFKTKDQEALYKLKLAYNFFFIESLPKPLKRQDLEAYKLNLGVASLLDNALFEGKQILDDEEQKQVEEFSAQVDRYYQEQVNSQLYLGKDKERRRHIEAGQQIEDEQMEGEENESELSVRQEQKEKSSEDKSLDAGEQQEQVSEQEEQENGKGTQYYMDMIRTRKDQNLDKQIFYLNDEIAIMLEQLIKDQIITPNFFHQVRKLPISQRVEEVNKLVKNYNQYHINKLNAQTESIQREEYEEDKRLKAMGIDTYEKRREYQQNKMRETKAQLLQEVTTLRQEISQAIQELDQVLQQQVQEEEGQLIEGQEDMNEAAQASQQANQQTNLEAKQQGQQQGNQQENMMEGVQQREQNQIELQKQGQEGIEGIELSDNSSMQFISVQLTEDEQFEKVVSALLPQSQDSEDMIDSILKSKKLKKLQSQLISESEEDQFIDNQYDNFVSRVLQSQENNTEQQTEIDGARDDRAIYFARNFHQIHEMEKYNTNKEEGEDADIAPIELQEQTQVKQQPVEGQEGQIQAQGQAGEVKQEGVFVAKKEAQSAQIQADGTYKRTQYQQLKYLQKQMRYIANQINDFILPIEYFDQEAPLEQIINLSQAGFYQTLMQIRRNTRNDLRRAHHESQQSQDDNYNNNRGWKKQKKQFFTKQNRSQQPPGEQDTKKKREVGFFKKIRSGFCTVNTTTGTEEKTDVPVSNLFDIQNIQKFRNEEVSRQFFNLMQVQSHIPRIGDGNIVAKYLFLQGRKDGAKGRVDPKKTMTIQFSTVVGTRSKSYEKYIKNTLYNYQLQEDFYRNLLQDQLKLYNRNEFKMIVAHIIHFKNTIPDQLISLICEIVQKHLIGYSLVEIAQFIKANGIKLSPQALQKIAKVWQRFDIINEDLLPFIKEYCAKVDIPFKTQYYSHFCRSLILTKKFEKLQALCDLVFAEIRPKPFKIGSTVVSAAEVEVLQKAWKQRQQEQFIRLYLQLLEVIVINLDTSKVPEFVIQLYEDYIKLRTELNQKELGYGMVCFCLKKDKFHQLLVYLQRHPELGTSFMYDCTLQALLSNFEELQEFAERILESSVIRNRIVLSNQQILKSMTIFKRAATSNAFSKFLEHSLRFQVDIDKQQDIKKQMFYVLNHNVQEVSVAGIFNLLDFIFSEKKEKERVEYRALMLAQEQKEKRLSQIQKQDLKTLQGKGKYQEKVKADKKEDKKKESEAKQETSDTNVSQNSAKLTPSKKKAEKAEKKMKKQKVQKKISQNQMVDQILSDQQSLVTEANKQQFSTSLNDDDLVNTIRSQSKKHESYKRKGVKAFGKIYQAVIQGMQSQEAAIREKQQRAKMGAKDEKAGKKPAKGKGKEKK